MKRTSDIAQAPFESSTFVARSGGTAAFVAAVLARLPLRPEQRVLDLGCGSGDFALALQVRRPDLDITGIDISFHNVALARARAEPSAGQRRPTFIHADYLVFANGTFDAILADSVLHLIAGQEEILIGKLSRDLKPGGLLIATLPIRSIGNAALMLQRRIWQHLPRSVDTLVLGLARLMHREEASQALADRITYLRILPSRFLDEAFSSALSRHGLHLVSVDPWPRPSLFKPEHRMASYRRSAPLW